MMPSGGKTKRSDPSGDPILDAYMADVKKIPLLSAEEERGLLAEAKAGDRQALNALVSANLRFVVAVCWNYRGRGLPLPDLINEGNLALFRAAENFAPSDIRFMSYAVWWIRQGALSALARQAGSIGFPPDRMHKALRYRKAERALSQKLGRAPDAGELEAAIGGSPRTLESIRSVLEGISSTRGFGTGASPLIDGASGADGEPAQEAVAEQYLIRKSLKSCLARLSPRERQILSLRYGLNHGSRLSLAEIGSMLCLTRERVRQIEETALAHLRRSVGAGAICAR